MADWPGKEDFEEAKADLSKDGSARRAFARRMAQALIDEDLEKVRKLSVQAPWTMFSRCSKDKMESSLPIHELRVKDASFAFEAGQAWGQSAGKNWPRCDKKLREYVAPLLQSGVEVRRHGLAFACGAISQAPSEDFKAWLLEAGIKSQWLHGEFGAAEVKIWGPSWIAQAQEQGNMRSLCAKALSQALEREWEGMRADALAAQHFALKLGEPREGWLVEAWKEARDRLDGEMERFQEAQSRRRSVIDAMALTKTRRQKREAQWEDMAVSLCARGPESWARLALGASKGFEPLRAKIEAAQVERAALPASSSAGSPRL